MKVLASLLRVVFSLIVLLLLAFYLQKPATVSLSEFCAAIDQNGMIDLMSTINVFSVLFVIILLLGICSFTRVLEAVWNVLFCVSILALLLSGLYTWLGPVIALPPALQNNDVVNQFCQSIPNYEVPLTIAMLIFVAGWICASACGRVAITTVISYALWFGISAFFTYLVHLWANDASPCMPETLNMVQSTPWIIAAVPGAFFLIYAIFMAFFETFITQSPIKAEGPEAKKAEKGTECTKAESDKKDSESNTSAPASKPVEPKTKSIPLTRTAAKAPATQKKLKPIVPAAENKTTAAVKPKAEEKLAEEPESAPKAEEKPAEKTESAPKAEEKPAEKPEPAPKAEEKPAEKPESAPKAEEKPAEKPESAPKAEEKPAEKPESAPKAEEKPAGKPESDEA